MILFASFAWLPATAQDSPHELSLHAGAGPATLATKAGTGVEVDGGQVGALFGVGYAYYFTPALALQTGIEYNRYSNKFALSALSGKYETRDNEGDEVEFSYTSNEYSETVNSGYLQIPVMVQFLAGIDRKNSFYVSAGMKLGLALSSTFDNRLDNLTTEGYYPSLNVTISGDSPDLGFGNYSGLSSDGELTLNTAFIAAAETGMMWKLSPGMSLYTGAYLDWGLNNIYKGGDSHPVEYNRANPGEPLLNSLTSSSAEGTASFMEKINIMALGIKVRLAFNL